jgi:hypothetical protein
MQNGRPVLEIVQVPISRPNSEAGAWRAWAGNSIRSYLMSDLSCQVPLPAAEKRILMFGTAQTELIAARICLRTNVTAHRRLNSKINMQEHVTFRYQNAYQNPLGRVGYEAQMLQHKAVAASNISRRARMLRKEQTRSLLVA